MNDICTQGMFEKSYPCFPPPESYNTIAAVDELPTALGIRTWNKLNDDTSE